MAKKYAYSYGDFALGKTGDEALAVRGKGSSRERFRLGVPRYPEEAARNALKAFVDAHTRQSVGDNPSIAYVVDKYVERLVEEKKRATEVKQRFDRIKPHMGSLEVLSLTDAVCQSYAKTMRKDGYARWSIWGDLNALRSALKWAFEKRELFPKPMHLRCWNIPKPEGRELVLTAAQVNALLDACDYEHIRLFVLLCILCGQRYTAILELKWDQVDFVRREIRFTKEREYVRPEDDNVLDKSFQKGRGLVPIGPYLMAALTAAHASSRTLNVIEFEGSPVGNIYRGFRVARDRAGLPETVTPHVLRHTAATWAAKNVSIEVVSKLLGHSDPRTTRDLYVHVGSDAAQPAADALEAHLTSKIRIVK